MEGTPLFIFVILSEPPSEIDKGLNQNEFEAVVQHPKQAIFVAEFFGMVLLLHQHNDWPGLLGQTGLLLLVDIL